MVHIEKRDRALLSIAIILTMITPVAISYCYSNITGWFSSAPIAYNPTDVIDGSSLTVETGITNGTIYKEVQTDTYDNSTDTVIIASLDWDSCNDATTKWVTFDMNTTFLATSDVTHISMAWNYAGTGNITQMTITNPSPYKQVHDFLTTSTYAMNGTKTWTLESFETQQVKSITQLDFAFFWQDTSNFPSDTDYIELTVTFYTSTAVLTQTQLLQGLAGGAGGLFILMGAIASPWWNPGKRRYGQR